MVRCITCVAVRLYSGDQRVGECHTRPVGRRHDEDTIKVVNALKPERGGPAGGVVCKGKGTGKEKSVSTLRPQGRRHMFIGIHEAGCFRVPEYLHTRLANGLRPPF